MRRLALAVLSLAFLANACQPATTELTEEQKAAIADTVNAANAANWDAWREVDLDRALSYFHDSPDFWFALEGQVLRGYAETDSFWREGFGTARRIDITISDSRTMVLTADIVTMVEQGVFSVTDSAGVTGPETAFAISATWARRDGEWKVLFGHESWAMPDSM